MNELLNYRECPKRRVSAVELRIVEALEREVNNGGHRQFLTNSSSEYAPIIVAALRRIGCPKTSDITQEALKIHSKNSEAGRQNPTIWSKSDLEKLDQCDSRYFTRPENIENQLFDFIKNNRNKFSR